MTPVKAGFFRKGPSRTSSARFIDSYQFVRHILPLHAKASLFTSPVSVAYPALKSGLCSRVFTIQHIPPEAELSRAHA